MKEKSQKMPLGYTILWLFFTAAYLVWMCFFMKYDTYPQNETGILRPWVFPVWIAASAVLLLLFIVYIKKFLYGERTKADFIFNLITLVSGCGFITWYCFLKDPFSYTASMIGLDYPWCFKLWGILATMSIFPNALFAFNKFGYNSRVGVIAGSVGCAALFITINVPSAGEDLILNSLRCMSHWTGALVFAFGAATPVVLLLLHLAKTKRPRCIALCVAFCVVLAVSLTLLATVGKDGIIEGIPTWSVYVVLFLLNYTHLFDAPKAVEAPEKETVHA